MSLPELLNQEAMQSNRPRPCMCSKCSCLEEELCENTPLCLCCVNGGVKKTSEDWHRTTQGHIIFTSGIEPNADWRN